MSNKERHQLNYKKIIQSMKINEALFYYVALWYDEF